MIIVNNSDSAIIVLHEIYGINEHIKNICRGFSAKGYDVICPNLINRSEPFDYESQEEAYNYFMNKVGFYLAAEKVKKIAVNAKKQYEHVYLLGYSIGATVAWLCSDEKNIFDGIIGYYGSRIRNYKDITPKCPVLLIFSEKEKSFDVYKVADCLNKHNVNIHILKGKHGFADLFSHNYCAESSKKAKKLVNDFLQKL